MKISIVTPTFNEEENIKRLCECICELMQNLQLEYEHIVIDNCSTDNTDKILREIAKKDKNLKIIFNERNFGHIRSPFYGLLQSNGDATILINSDFQEPLELIPKYIEKWKEGKKIVLGRRSSSDENIFLSFLRDKYYKTLNKISDIKLSKNTSGTGIFDKEIIQTLKKIRDPYPYFRGLLFEITSDISYVDFHQKKREHGETKNNFYTLYDYLALALIKHSKTPLRLLTVIGFITSIISLFITIFFFIYKILFWNSFQLGIAPLIIGLFGIISVQLFFLGFIGEYLMQILTQQRNLPLVVEKERINF